MIRSFREAKTQQNNFFPTNTTLKKELSYYGTKIIKPSKLFTPQYVKKLSSVGGSQDSHYYQVPYLDPISQQIGRFLVDSGWRKKAFERIVNEVNSPPELLIRVGEKVDFLLRVS
jgi:hypothetical protein